MSENVRKNKMAWKWTLRIILTVACVLMTIFIFSNSLKTGEQSARQSSAMVDTVQDVASVIAPNSSVAKATGEAYERLHAWVRIFAHFAEFALFGALLLWCVVSYTWKEKAFVGAIAGVCIFPIIDETLQRFVAERGAEISDVCADIAGGLCGVLFALTLVFLILSIQEKRRKKKENLAEKHT